MAVTTTDFTPRVWPGCLSCYNSGRLVGHWVDCVGADTVTLQAIHEGTGGPFPGCEEIWCLDIENVPVGREIGLDEAAEWGRVFTEAPSDRSNSPCPGCSRTRAVSNSAVKSASVCADPRCSIPRSRPPIRSAICTAMAPEVVFTFRTKATNRTLPTRLVCQTNRPYPAEQHKLRSITSDRQKWHESDQA